MAARIQISVLLAVLATCAYGDVLKVAMLHQESSHGANGKKAVEAWAASAAVTGASYTVEMHYIPWVKDEAANLVKPLTTPGSDTYVHVLLGPYGSGDNIAMINEVDASFEGVILVWGGASGSIFTGACATLGRCFGFFTTAANYMTTGINAVDAVNTDPVKVAVIANNNAFSKSVAAGAKATIEASAGVELYTEAQINVAKTDLTEEDMHIVKQTISFKPDMYVIAGHNKDVEPVIMMIAESGVLPHAILATNSITGTAVANFEAKEMGAIAHCLMMPTQWAELADVADDIVGWTTADFKAAMGDSATYHSASAGAAAIAISHAMAAGGASDLLASFKALNFESFYGKISFNDHGEILKPMYTQQKQAEGNVIVAPASGVAAGVSMSYPLNTCSGWDSLPPPTEPPTDDHGHDHDHDKEVKCSDVKMAYKESGCCGNPAATFKMGRRLSELRGKELLSSISEAGLLNRLKRELRAARAAGGEAKARELADKVSKLTQPYIK